jgi:deoxyinosine 3'endonuclease (endonuclease V)
MHQDILDSGLAASPICFTALPSRHAAPREVPSYLQLISQLQHDGLDIDVILVDGFGSVHPRGAGAATQLGVQAQLPCIGVGKRLSGTCELREREILAEMDKRASLQLEITSCSKVDVGTVSNHSCVAVRGHLASRRPVYVSVTRKDIPKFPRISCPSLQVGHMCSASTAAAVVQSCLVYSQPEPIRLADIASRAALRVGIEHAQAAALSATQQAASLICKIRSSRFSQARPDE